LHRLSSGQKYTALFGGHDDVALQKLFADNAVKVRLAGFVNRVFVEHDFQGISLAFVH